MTQLLCRLRPYRHQPAAAHRVFDLSFQLNHSDEITLVYERRTERLGNRKIPGNVESARNVGCPPEI